MTQPIDSLATANDTLDAPRRVLRRRLVKRLRGGPMAPFTGGPKGRFLLVRDVSATPERSLLLLSERLGSEVARSEACLAEALMNGSVERVVGDWRRTHTTLTFVVEQGEVGRGELAFLLDGTGESWDVVLEGGPAAARGLDRLEQALANLPDLAVTQAAL